MMLSEFKETCKALSSDRYDKFYQSIECAYVGFIGSRKLFCSIIDELVFDNMFCELDGFLSTCQESGNSYPDSYGQAYISLIYPIFSEKDCLDFCIKGKQKFDNEICAFLEGEYIHDHFLDLSLQFDYYISTLVTNK